MSAIPKREQQEVATELAAIFKQEKKEDAVLNLAASTRQISEALS
jgi:putative transposase